MEDLRKNVLAMIARQKKLFRVVPDKTVQYYRICGMLSMARDIGAITLNEADKMRDDVALIAFGEVKK